MRSYFADIWHQAPQQLNVALIFVLVHLTQWPDWELPWKAAVGLPIIGDVPDSNVFAAIREPRHSVSTLFLPPAIGITSSPMRALPGVPMTTSLRSSPLRSN
eukprot:6478049-Amphidinium_carterae.1